LNFIKLLYNLFVDFCLSFTRFSILPKPGVLYSPASAIVEKSAKFACKRPLVAQPPSSLNPSRRNSFIQTSTDFCKPSSASLLFSFFLLRIPIITVLTLLKFGEPTIVILLPVSCP